MNADKLNLRLSAFIGGSKAFEALRQCSLTAGIGVD
jgi:hypothetical protein